MRECLKGEVMTEDYNCLECKGYMYSLWEPDGVDTKQVCEECPTPGGYC